MHPFQGEEGDSRSDSSLGRGGRLRTLRGKVPRKGELTAAFGQVWRTNQNRQQEALAEESGGAAPGRRHFLTGLQGVSLLFYLTFLTFHFIISKKKKKRNTTFLAYVK